jgi:hypothetical protein
MNSDAFNEVKKEFDAKESELLGIKKTEYASDTDRLINFKEASRMVGLTPEHYCLVLITKHYHAISRAVSSGKYGWCWNNDLGEGLKQRIADARNYLLLLAAILEEEQHDGQDAKTLVVPALDKTKVL